MARPLWFVALIKKPFRQRQVLARFTRLPILGSLIETLLFDGDRIFQLPSDGVIQVDQPVDQPPEMVLPSRVVEHFIEQARYHWIMDTCICRDASHCQDYPVDLGCLFLGEAVLGINPKLGRLVTREEALAHVRLCRDAGLVHIIGRNKLDTVWLGVGPGDRLMTICNCCPCCCLWRMLPQLDPEIAASVTRMPGVTVSVTEHCAGCGTCTEGVCFVDAIHLLEDRAVITDACRGCGRCVTVCPQNAIELSIDDIGFTDKSIQQLSSLVDVT
jgi:ferredoxin